MDPQLQEIQHLMKEFHVAQAAGKAWECAELQEARDDRLACILKLQKAKKSVDGPSKEPATSPTPGPS